MTSIFSASDLATVGFTASASSASEYEQLSDSTGNAGK